MPKDNPFAYAAAKAAGKKDAKPMMKGKGKKGKKAAKKGK